MGNSTSYALDVEKPWGIPPVMPVRSEKCRKCRNMQKIKKEMQEHAETCREMQKNAETLAKSSHLSLKLEISLGRPQVGDFCRAMELTMGTICMAMALVLLVPMVQVLQNFVLKTMESLKLLADAGQACMQILKNMESNLESLEKCMLEIADKVVEDKMEMLENFVKTGELRGGTNSQT